VQEVKQEGALRPRSLYGWLGGDAFLRADPPEPSSIFEFSCFALSHRRGRW